MVVRLPSGREIVTGAAPAGPFVRKARTGEAGALTALCRRSKAHWGYDADFMRLANATIEVESAQIAAGDVGVCADAGDRPLGVYALADEGEGVFDLDLFFVDPPAIGSGVGRLLFAALREDLAERGARRLTILADPNAGPFYARMGATYRRDAPSNAIPGRLLPLYELDL